MKGIGLKNKVLLRRVSLWGAGTKLSFAAWDFHLLFFFNDRYGRIDNPKLMRLRFRAMIWSSSVLKWIFLGQIFKGTR